ncbi:mucin-5AC-like [Thrips palmi]|uniref:Mucin-5AC-like n=1 Tax=Thrips palmi TaxID=161013 RepID=A0A6P8Y8E3_THRPL|nr:mucin-5AC-like [Thrips palmi]
MNRPNVRTSVSGHKTLLESVASAGQDLYFMLPGEARTSAATDTASDEDSLHGVGHRATHEASDVTHRVTQKWNEPPVNRSKVADEHGVVARTVGPQVPPLRRRTEDSQGHIAIPEPGGTHPEEPASTRPTHFAEAPAEVERVSSSSRPLSRSPRPEPPLTTIAGNDFKLAITAADWLHHGQPSTIKPLARNSSAERSTVRAESKWNRSTPTSSMASERHGDAEDTLRHSIPSEVSRGPDDAARRSTTSATTSATTPSGTADNATEASPPGWLGAALAKFLSEIENRRRTAAARKPSSPSYSTKTSLIASTTALPVTRPDRDLGNSSASGEADVDRRRTTAGPAHESNGNGSTPAIATKSESSTEPLKRATESPVSTTPAQRSSRRLFVVTVRKATSNGTLAPERADGNRSVFAEIGSASSATPPSTRASPTLQTSTREGTTALKATAEDIIVEPTPKRRPKGATVSNLVPSAEALKPSKKAIVITFSKMKSGGNRSDPKTGPTSGNETLTVLNETFALDRPTRDAQAIPKTPEALKKLIVEYVLAMQTRTADGPNGRSSPPPSAATTGEATTGEATTPATTTSSSGSTETASSSAWPRLTSSTRAPAAPPAFKIAPWVAGRPRAQVLADGNSVVLYVETADCSPEIADTISTLEEKAPSDGTEKVVIEMNCRPSTRGDAKGHSPPPSSRRLHGRATTAAPRATTRDFKVIKLKQITRKPSPGPSTTARPSPAFRPGDLEIESRFDQRKAVDARATARTTTRTLSKIKWKVGITQSGKSTASRNRSRGKLPGTGAGTTPTPTTSAPTVEKTRPAAVLGPTKEIALEAKTVINPFLSELAVVEAPAEAPLFDAEAVDEPVAVRLGEKDAPPTATTSTSRPGGAATATTLDTQWSFLKIVSLLDGPEAGLGFQAAKPTDAAELGETTTTTATTAEARKLTTAEKEEHSSRYGRAGQVAPGTSETTSATATRTPTAITTPLKRILAESAATAAASEPRTFPSLPPLNTTSTTSEPRAEDSSFVGREKSSSSPSPEGGVSQPTSARPIQEQSAENATPDPPDAESTFTTKNKTSEAAPTGTPLSVRSSRSDVSKRRVRGRGTAATAATAEGPEAVTTMSPARRITAARTSRTVEHLNLEECTSLCKPKYQRTVCAQVGNSTRTFASLCDVRIEGCLTGESTRIRNTGPCSRWRRKKTKVTIEQDEEVKEEDASDDAPPRAANRTSVVQTNYNKSNASS